MERDDEYLTMTEAQEALGVSRFKIWQLVRDGVLQTYESSLDKRQKLIRRADLDAVKRPRPRPTGVDPKKAAA